MAEATRGTKDSGPGPDGGTPAPDLASAETVAAQSRALAEVLGRHRGERHILVLQEYPDPDAIASAFAHKLISREFDIEVDLVYSGRLSHQQNVALVKLLGIELRRYEAGMSLRPYQGAVFVDHQGTTAEGLVAALEEAEVPILIVVDHHEPQRRMEPEYADLRRIGATSTIYAEYLEQGLVQLDKADQDHRVAATALMHGLLTDTAGFVRAGPADFQAAGYLSEYRDADVLSEILSQDRPKGVMEVIHQALGNRMIVESFSLAGTGYLRAEDRDAIPQAADFLLTEQNVHSAIVYGIVTEENRETLVGSMRTSKLTLDPDEFIKDALGKDVSGRYFGGGRPLAGGFEIPIGFLSGDGGEDYRRNKWAVYDAQVKHRLLEKIGVGQPGQEERKP